GRRRRARWPVRTHFGQRARLRYSCPRNAAREDRTGWPLGYGVIGNTADSGSVVLGSSPGTPASHDADSGHGVRVFAVPFSVLLRSAPDITQGWPSSD